LFRIKTVIPGSPAAEIGLQPSDLIEQVNGIPAIQWTLETLDEAFSEPGRTFDLVVSSQSGSKRSVKFLTRTLI